MVRVSKHTVFRSSCSNVTLVRLCSCRNTCGSVELCSKREWMRSAAGCVEADGRVSLKLQEPLTRDSRMPAGSPVPQMVKLRWSDTRSGQGVLV